MQRTLGRWLVLAWALGLVGCGAQIQQGLEERQANGILTLLAERGISAQKQLEGGKKPSWAIEVPRDDAAASVRMLAELGLPRRQSEGFSELFGKASLVPSAAEERARFLQALSGEMAATLEAFEGVVAARVHLVLPGPSRPGQSTPEAKAAAFLRVRPGGSGRISDRAAELRALIAGGAEGLSPDAVTVVVEEVVSSRAPSPSRVDVPSARLRVLATVLALVVLGLAVALILLTLKLRVLRCRLGVGPPPLGRDEAPAVRNGVVA